VDCEDGIKVDFQESVEVGCEERNCKVDGKEDCKVDRKEGFEVDCE
jgi:hypothetical protein